MADAYIKLAAWVLIALLVSLINRRFIFFALVAGGVVQSIIGFFQFFWHRDLGLQWLGESVLRPDNLEVARTYLGSPAFAEGFGGQGEGLLLRAYGTFPHPNVLAAFLVLALIASYYLFFLYRNVDYSHGRDYSRHFILALLTGVIFILWLGLLLTFARVGWLIAGLATAGFLVVQGSISQYWGCRKSSGLTTSDRQGRCRLWRLEVEPCKILIVIIIVLLIVLFSIFHWAIIPRLATLTPDNFTVQERLGDYRLAWQMIKEKPWLGYGLTLNMGERPIHNLYLLIATEVGLVGLAVFLIFVGWLYFRNIVILRQGRRILKDSSCPQVLQRCRRALTLRMTSLLMLTCLLLYGFFDHFLWTLRPGLGMFWLVVGMLL
ncbi:MAG: hypothetical protein ABH822_00445 [Patescibacteria group bacterium]